MVIVVPQDIQFFYKKELTIQEVADVLLSLDHFSRRAAQISIQFQPNLRGASYSVGLKKLESGSLMVDLVTKFITEASIERIKEDFYTMPTHDFLVDNSGFLVTIFGLVAIYGWRRAIASRTPNIEPKVLINTQNNFHISLQEQGFNPHEVQKFIEATQTDKHLPKQAVQLTKHFREDESTSISFGKSLTIEPDALLEVPSVYQEPELHERFHNVRLEIRAMDLDRGKTGWSVIFPDLPNMPRGRIRLKVADWINRERIAFRKELVGEVSIAYKTDDHGRKIIRYAELLDLSSQ
ncbi:MAG: hypothetical protein HQL07_12970 [Nitrospirae bacterium]|nr:hypothetical protein [Magnetococcales bacterium]